MSRPHVTVRDPAATLRRGLESALAAAGFTVDQPADLPAWAGGAGDRVAVLSLRHEESCALVEGVAAAGGSVVALMSDATLDSYRHALGHGAVAAVDGNAEPEVIVDAVTAATRSLTLLPADVARALARGGPSGHAPRVDPEELAWLTALAGGMSVVELADEVGYSERSLFRRLHDLYEKLGVQGRAEAMLEAGRMGLLVPAQSRDPSR
jgi:DNA-binding NarL/FixJ family response regulator